MTRNSLPSDADVDTNAIAHARITVPLQARIRAEIAAQSGWLSFARFMELALYAPGLGYYVNGARKFGAAGDFVTSPEISPLFGRTLARWAIPVMQASANEVLEFGAGTGALAADLLNACAALGTPITRYRILDLSPELRFVQADTLKKRAPQWLSRVTWEERLPISFSGVVLANEVLDAMPVQLVRWSPEGIFERGVSWNVTEQHFVYADRPAQGELLDVAQRLNATHDLCAQAVAHGGQYVSEVGLTGLAWTRSLGAWLHQGAALLIDYGFPAHEFYHAQRAQGTLMCHTRHRAHPDPFDRVGLTDLTAHVDFSAVSSAALEAGLETIGFASQAQFLINAGLIDALGEMNASVATDADRFALSAQVQHLTSPAEMGELFKVIAFAPRAALEQNPALAEALHAAFSRADRQARL